jgi:hypothetical protein
MFFNNTPTKTTLTHHAFGGGVVAAFCETCEEAVAMVVYSVSGIDMIITQWAVHPSLSSKEWRYAGDLMDVELVKEAQKLSVRQLFLIHPADPVRETKEWMQLVRTYRPCVSALPQLSSTNRPTYLNN